MLTSANWDALLARQQELEDACMARGGERFRRRLEQAKSAGQASTVGAAKRLLLRGLTDMEAALRQFVDDSATMGRGRRHCALKWVTYIGEVNAAAEIRDTNARRAALKHPLPPLEDVECDAIRERRRYDGLPVIAYLTLKVILDGIEQKRPLYKVSGDIVDLLLDELRYRRFETEAPGLFKYKMASFQTSSYAHMARSLNASMRFADIDTSDLKMSVNHTALVGAKLVDLLMHSTGLIELVSTASVVKRRGRLRPKAELLVQATADTLTWLTKGNAAMEFLTPFNLPMVVPPLQWAQGVRGGYRYALRNKYSLVRAVSKAHANMLEQHAMPLVYQAVNAIQNTAWAINPRVFETVQRLAEMGGGVAGIPEMEPLPMPAKPQDIDTNEEARRAWRKQAHAVKEADVQRRVRALEFTRTFSMARSVKDEEAIFFPYNLDFRGRIYPVSTFLSPQGDDLSKGLLKFAQGKPIGVDGGRWLAIHGANVLGETPEGLKVSKMTLDEREAWISDHTKDIFHAAEEPLRYTWWAKAEEPLQFLAFCFEWAAWHSAGCSPEFVSAAVVSVDGSCNGLQHFSAMLRDEIGGKAVNVVPQDRPQDIYQKIADHVADQLQEMAAAGNELAMLWLGSGLITRKLTKRPTMTFGYGSKQYGFQEQLLDYLQGLDNWPEVRTLFMEAEDSVIVGACALMSKCIWLALQETVVAASQGMAWLQRCARQVVKTGQPVKWSVPATGFPVVQEYYEVKVQQIETMLAGRVIRPAVYTPTPSIEVHKQVNAIAPNVVHSLDAAALMFTVSRAMNDGVEAFAAIHDSYGTVPGDMSILAQATRESFVALYQQHDVVTELLSQFASQAPDNTEIPAPPPMGSLDVSAVLASAYFFS